MKLCKANEERIKELQDTKCTKVRCFGCSVKDGFIMGIKEGAKNEIEASIKTQIDINDRINLALDKQRKAFLKVLNKINFEELLSFDNYLEETLAEDGDDYDEWCAMKIYKELEGEK